MKIGVLGTGTVGQALASKFIELGHGVCMGSRTPDNAVANAWAVAAGSNALAGTFADAASYGELLVNATSGAASMAILRSLDGALLAGKVLIDVANPLDFSEGFAKLSVVNTDSLGEQIQREFPQVRVVKTFNNMNCQVMVDPSRVHGQTVFLSGDDGESKQIVRQLINDFGWPDADIIDLGGIASARATEMFLPLWIQLMTALGTADFGVQVTR